MPQDPQEGYGNAQESFGNAQATGEDDVEGHSFTNRPQESFGQVQHGHAQESFGNAQATTEDEDVEGHSFNITRGSGGE
jgi:hypothetical protein